MSRDIEDWRDWYRVTGWMMLILGLVSGSVLGLGLLGAWLDTMWSVWAVAAVIIPAAVLTAPGVLWAVFTAIEKMTDP